VIRLDEVTKRYANGQVAVRDLTLEVDAGDVCVLVGPSGSGKTTTMRMINRLIEPTSGRILLDGEDVTHVDPVRLRRRIGYVIQQVGLFPHQTVAENVATVPRLLGWDRARVRARVDELLELVGLDPGEYRARYPHQLSGGQRQRIGVARALGADPPVLLMDEPFGAIDPITRDRLQNEFLRLQAEVKKTVVFVTHDVEEAVKVGDRIAILAQGGVLAQHGTPAEVLANPASPFVADFVGADRGLKRLAVTRIDTEHLDHPPVVGAADPVEDARRAAAGTALGIAVAVDGEGRGLGYVEADRESGLRPLEPSVPLSATLRQALAQLLLSDAGWVAVVDDGERYLGVLTPAGIHAATRDSNPGA
jgi:osmoprotectant transport system ATP-binding protein